MVNSSIASLAAATLAITSLTTLAREWLYLRSVERYRAAVEDHAQVVEYAVAIHPRRHPP